MEQLGTPFAWSVFVVIAIAVAAAMILYGVYAVRKRDEPRSIIRRRQRHLKAGLGQNRQHRFSPSHARKHIPSAAHPPS
jgi:hypothetical protein